MPPKNAKGTALRTARVFLSYWALCCVCGWAAWLHAAFGPVSLGQVLFHLRYLGGVDTVDRSQVIDAIVYGGIAPLIVAVLASWIRMRVLGPLLGRTLADAQRRRAERLADALPAVAMIGVLAATLVSMDAADFLVPSNAPDFFADHYVAPSPAQLRARHPRNLVLIYVESLETSYARADVFGRNLLANLDALHPASIEQYEQMPGTGWTMAGIVATQCGVPLRVVGLAAHEMQGLGGAGFLSGATCLGDLLADAGYRNVFMGGASLEFSGKGEFFREHRYGQTFGREQWADAGYAPLRLLGWGLHDSDLFVRAKAELRALHEAGQPFNLTLLTVDTHAPTGFDPDGCPGRVAKGLDDIVECSASRVADFVSFVREAGYAADTNVVVLGDHLSMRNTLGDQLARVDPRRIYNGFFSQTPPRFNRSTAVHFDMLPTLLDFIGLEVAGGRAGLGYSALLPSQAVPTDAARAEMAARVLAPSKIYTELWTPGVPRPAPEEPARAALATHP